MRLDAALRRGADVVVVVGGWSGWSPCCLMCSLRSCISRLVALDESVVMPVMPGVDGGERRCCGMESEAAQVCWRVGLVGRLVVLRVSVDTRNTTNLQ
jgi:hypothetical protein